MLIYIAGPYRGDVENNIKKARALAAKCYLKGHNCITPHLNSAYMDLDTGLGDEFWLNATMELLKKCDAICMVDGWEESVGSVAEFRYAMQNNIPVYVDEEPKKDELATEDELSYLSLVRHFNRHVKASDVDSLTKEKAVLAEHPKTPNKNSIFDAADPNCETVTHANGSSESKTDLRFDLLPAVEIATIAKILGEGSVKYGDNNWHGITTESNLNHALQHIFAFLAGDESDDHLGHAATRLLFAMYKENNKT